jgi:hypothetical protein
LVGAPEGACVGCGVMEGSGESEGVKGSSEQTAASSAEHSSPPSAAQAVAPQQAPRPGPHGVQWPPMRSAGKAL